MNYIKCAICSKEVKVYPCKIKTKRTCSKICSNLLRIKEGRFSGDKNPAYKGGKVIDKNGYVRIRGSIEKRRYEHQVVMESYLNRKLIKGEEVHHINGIKTDNRLENLYLVDKRSHSRKHFDLFLKIQKLEWENKWLKKELDEKKTIN